MLSIELHTKEKQTVTNRKLLLLSLIEMQVMKEYFTDVYKPSV